MEVGFEGSAVRWIATKAPSRGIASVTIDGVEFGPVDLYAPAWSFQQVAFEADGLGSGPHTMVITLTGQKRAEATATFIEIDAIEADRVHGS